MKYEIGICNSCEGSFLIVNKTHKLCETCNQERLTNQGKKKPVKTRIAKKTKPIRSINPKMSKGLKLYEKVKEVKKKDMIEGGYYRCFFSNKPLDENVSWPWHHALGRKGSLLYEYKNIFPCIDEYHKEYHDLSVQALMRTEWYPRFFERVRKQNRNVYNKELRRMNKGGIIDDEQFFKMYLN
jgi:hypothetical protein